MVWAFLRIWYENSWFWVHEVKRLDISLYMALCIPFHLWQRISRVYQDYLRLRRVFTSFVLPAHYQDVSLAPLQGCTLRWIFLPTTDSFFVLFLLTFCLLLHPGTSQLCFSPDPIYTFHTQFASNSFDFFTWWGFTCTGFILYPAGISRVQTSNDRSALFRVLQRFCHVSLTIPPSVF